MKVKLIHDTLVRMASGTVLDVSEAEAKRLIAFNNAEPVTEAKPAQAKKATKKKKADK